MPSFFLIMRRPPISTLFPPPTLFRSSICMVRASRSRSSAAMRSSGGTRRGTSGDRKSTRLNSSHCYISYAIFFFNNAATPDIYPLSPPDALPIFNLHGEGVALALQRRDALLRRHPAGDERRSEEHTSELQSLLHLVCHLFF